jgi:uncharacterized membrane protein
MGILGLLLVIVGGIISLIGGIWFLIAAFQESVLWGLACMLVPLASLLFLIFHSNRALNPFLLSFGGGVLFYIGYTMAIA